MVELAHGADRACAGITHDVHALIEDDVFDAVAACVDGRAVFVEAKEALDLGRGSAAEETQISIARAFKGVEVLLEFFVQAHAFLNAHAKGRALTSRGFVESVAIE